MTEAVDRDVRVWLWPTEQASADLQQRYAHWLNDEEHARCERLKIDRVRFEYVMTRVLCRHALSTVEPSVDPAAWTFERNEHGKPEVVGPTGRGRPPTFAGGGPRRRSA